MSIYFFEFFLLFCIARRFFTAGTPPLPFWAKVGRFYPPHRPEARHFLGSVLGLQRQDPQHSIRRGIIQNACSRIDTDHFRFLQKAVVGWSINLFQPVGGGVGVGIGQAGRGNPQCPPEDGFPRSLRSIGLTLTDGTALFYFLHSTVRKLWVFSRQQWPVPELW